jgi:hypothetical protein
MGPLKGQPFIHPPPTASREREFLTFYDGVNIAPLSLDMPFLLAYTRAGRWNLPDAR